MKVFTSNKFPIKAWVDHVPEIEEAARRQLDNVANMPFIHKHVAVMPDCHWGMGATVGSVIATKGAIIPAAVGVDLGCGMTAVLTSLRADQLPDNLAALRSSIEAAVPYGRTNHGGPGDKGAHRDLDHLPEIVEQQWDKLRPKFSFIATKYSKVNAHNPQLQLGTLGTGNHFIEVCLDEQDRVWVMLHSGSRGVGNRIGSYFIAKAKEDMQRWFINLPDQDLAYIPEGSEVFYDYMFAVSWAQDFARVNRECMMLTTLEALRLHTCPLLADVVAVNCHHNYISREKHFGESCLVTRKGAVSAREGELGIIPGSMGQRSYIVRGKGNRDSFHSCSHGAGRVMSRAEAKKRFTVEDHAKATEGLECRKDAGVIDETRDAYKKIDAVMASQADLVEVVHTLRAVLCVKG